MEIQLSQKALGRLLVKGYGVVGRNVTILTVREDVGYNRPPAAAAAAAAALLHGDLVIRHFDALLVFVPLVG